MNNKSIYSLRTVGRAKAGYLCVVGLSFPCSTRIIVRPRGRPENAPAETSQFKTCHPLCKKACAVLPAIGWQLIPQPFTVFDVLTG